MYKKYFQNIKIDSIFYNEETKKHQRREFTFGNKDIVTDAKIEDTTDTKTWSKVSLKGKKDGQFDKTIDVISKKVLESLLPYFIRDGYNPPLITLKDEQSSIVLNDLYKENDYIKNIKTDTFELIDKDEKKHTFSLFLFKIYSPKNQKSSIVLVADKREVTSTNIMKFIPEFEDEFCDDNNNFIVKAYVTSEYLDNNVNVERLGFKFSKSNKELKIFKGRCGAQYYLSYEKRF